MKLSSVITEMGDNPQEITKWSKKGRAEIASFKAGEYEYDIWFNNMKQRDGIKEVVIEFVLTGGGGKNASIKIAQTGEAVKVFATVIDTIKKWVKKNKPDIIEFDASEKNRRKLYLHFVKKIAPSLGYESETDDESAIKWGDFRLVSKNYKDSLSHLKKKK